MSERPKTANYRRSAITDGNGAPVGGQTLQDLLAGATKGVERPWLRKLGAGNAAHQLLTTVKTKNLCLCGEIVYYEPGRRIPLVDIQADGTTWQDTVHPNDSAGKARKWQEQSLYFAIRENHVAIIQSVSLQAAELESFLAWLIQEKAQLAAGSLLSLSNPPSKAALEKLKDHRIKAIRFGERLFTSVSMEAPLEDGKPRLKRRKLVHRIETSPRILGVLIGLGLPQPIIDKLADNPDPGSIQVDVEVSYRSRGEKDGAAVLRSLAGTLGSQEGLETEIRLSGDSSIKGSELTIRGPILVQCPAGCVAVDDALSKLSRWLADKIKAGEVT